ncbi:MAG: hypothetical protein QOJ21_3985 [Solirubrobacteraceae bacterium]|jgi:hypothetical protein|nr:hypothetical protein [Solirubrobacteraceae bacterium]
MQLNLKRFRHAAADAFENMHEDCPGGRRNFRVASLFRP